MAASLLNLGQAHQRLMEEVEMTCIEAMRKLSDYLQGRLPVSEARTLRHHVGHCEGCRTVARSAQQTIRTYFTPNADRRATDRHAA